MTCDVMSLPHVQSEEADNCCGCGVRLRVRFLNACDSCDHLACDSCIRENFAGWWYCPHCGYDLQAEELIEMKAEELEEGVLSPRAPGVFCEAMCWQ